MHRSTTVSPEPAMYYISGGLWVGPMQRAVLAVSFVFTRPSVLFVGHNYANSEVPNQTTQNVASDQGPYCLLTECSIIYSAYM